PYEREDVAVPRRSDAERGERAALVAARRGGERPGVRRRWAGAGAGPPEWSGMGRRARRARPVRGSSPGPENPGKNRGQLRRIGRRSPLLLGPDPIRLLLP